MNPRIRLIIIALAIIGGAIYLLPTWQYSQLNAEREALEADTSEAGRLALARWDSLHYEDWLDAREDRIKLGLDLRGGVYITMEVDVPALLQETADPDLTDEVFEEVMAAVREEAETSDDPVLEIFQEKFDEIARPQGKSLLDYYDLNLNDVSDQAVLDKLQENIDDAVDQAREVIEQRVNKYGLTEPSIQVQGSRRIIVELPDEKDPQAVRELLSRTARLEFKLVKNDADAVALFAEINNALRGSDDGVTGEDEDDLPEETVTDDDTTDTPEENDTTTDDQVASGDTTGDTTGDTSGDTSDNGVAAADTAGDDAEDTTNPYTGLSEEEAQKRYRTMNPFTSLIGTVFQPAYQGQQQQADGVYEAPNPPQGEYSFYVAPDDVAKVREILSRPEIRAMIPEDRQIAFSAYPLDQNVADSPFELTVLKAEPELRGEVVTDAGASIDQMNGRPVVQMAMNLAGAQMWGEVTGANIHKRVAVVLDSAVYSSPWIQGRIDGGQTQITGSNDVADAELLATILKSGALKAPVTVIEERVVGPSLGADQVDRGINAVLFAALLVILFMAIYYAFGGVIADLAVMLNVFFTLAFLAALQGTLTLPGIGALVLTIGMAVDANILIYERIREELALGKPLKTAVQLGYEKAFSAIIDSNITTFLTGLILAAFGSGPIQGFAIMLMIGIAGTLFTAVFITRAVFEFMLERDVRSINFGQPKSRAV